MSKLLLPIPMPITKSNQDLVCGCSHSLVEQVGKRLNLVKAVKGLHL